MEKDDIYPRLKFNDDYKIEVKEKNSFFKSLMTRMRNNVKMLPSPDDRNFKETNISINTMWRFGNAKAFITQKMDRVYGIFTFPKSMKIKQKNVEIEVIGKNNIVKNISTATKKLNLINPIIPKSKEEKNI